MRIRLPAALVLLLSSIFFGTGVHPPAAAFAPTAQTAVQDGAQHRQATQVPMTAQPGTKAGPQAGFAAVPAAGPPSPALPVSTGTAERPATPVMADRLASPARAPPASA
ncbi:hypothetical protein [Nonomuraea sp. NPDC050310]|uniref:hypothetical protein n=1 Tax=unclassified Nonomuraea TaxID=2593643 RepID=UPI0033E9906B